MMTELLEDIKEMSRDQDLNDPPISNTLTLKGRPTHKLGDSIGFHVFGRSLVVYPTGANPMIYSEANDLGHGLREDDLRKAFSRLI